MVGVAVVVVVGDRNITTDGATVTVGFTVYGRPQPRGSKKAFPIKRASGKLGVAMADSNPKSKDWMQEVRSAAAKESTDVLTGPVTLEVTFYFRRPASHFGTGKNGHKVKESAPREHTQTPDLDKLVRAIGDGITGVLIHDDKQIVALIATKKWTEGQEGALVSVHIIPAPTGEEE